MRPTPSFVLFALAACSEPVGDYLVVTVDKRPAVNNATSLEVRLTNEGSDRSQKFDLGNKQFPVTFSVATPGRLGDLGIEVLAFDAAGLLVGRGASTTTVDMEAAAVTVDTADFVINTEFAEDQQLSNYSPAIGYQLATTMDGTWTAVHSGDCFPTPCHVFGRRFDPTGKPVTSTIAAGTNGFPMSIKLTTSWSTPVVGAAGSTTMAVWNHDIEPTPPSPQPGYSIDCRTFDASGAALTSQVVIATDEFANMAAVTGLPSGNFAVVWEGRVTNDMIRAAIVGPNCVSLAGSLVQVSPAGGLPQYPSVAVSGNTIIYAWLLDNNVHVRTASMTNALGATVQVTTKTATEHVRHVRVAALPGGNFAVFSRWTNSTGTMGPGRIEMQRVNNAGVAQGAPVIVTTRSGTDFGSNQGFGVAAHSDGSIFVVWHSCMMLGDDNGCGVFGKLVSSGGQLGPELQLNTTTKDDQTGPSAVALPGTPATFVTAWTDRSGNPPDSAGASVRARIVYPAATGAN